MGEITIVDQAKAALVRKLVGVMKEIDHVEKRGKNIKQDYKYMKATDIAHAVRDKLAEQNILLISDVVSSDRFTNAESKLGQGVFLLVEYTFLDGDGGGEIKFKIPGCGVDFGDKAAYKALTGSLKYALRNTFLVPDDSDPEADKREGAVSAIIENFQQFHVTISMIEQKLGHSLAQLTEEDKSVLRGVFKALEDGAKVEEHFKTAKPPAAVQPPPVDHTPAKGTDEPRPGEVKPAAQEPENVQNLDKPPAASADDKKEINLNARLRDFQSLIGDGAKEKEAFKQYILTYTGCAKTADVPKTKWVEVLKALDVAKAAGPDALKGLVGLNKT